MSSSWMEAMKQSRSWWTRACTTPSLKLCGGLAAVCLGRLPALISATHCATVLPPIREELELELELETELELELELETELELERKTEAGVVSMV